MKHRIAIGTFAVAMLALAGLTAGEGLKSGPAEGTNIPGAFHPLNLTGKQEGNKHCLV